MDNQSSIPVTMCTTKNTLTASGAATTLGSTGTIQYSIRGKAYSASALSSTATPTTDWVTGAAFNPVLANFGCVFTIGLDAAGTVRVVQGTIVPLDGIVSSNKFINAPQFGGLGPQGSGTADNNFCPIAYIVIQNGTAGSSWTFGTNNWNATGITVTVVDLMGLPDRPQIS